MLFQKFQFGLYSFLLRFKILPILLLLTVIGWSYFSISFYFRFNNNQSVYFKECISKYIDQHQTKEEGYLLPLNSILKIIPVYSKAELQCQIINNSEKSNLEYDQIHLFRDMSLQYLPKDVKEKHNINQTKIYMNMDKIAKKLVYEYFGVYQILISNIADYLQTKQLRGVHVRQLTRHQETVEVYNIHSKSTLIYFFSKFIILLDSVLRVFFCSVFAGIIMMASITVIIRVIIICGQIVYKLTKNDTILVYFPFLNHYLESLRDSHKKYIIKYILLAYLGVGFIILYGLSYFVNSLLKSSLIGLYYKQGNTIGFYESIIIEFASLIILRTRTSIKHSPRIILFILITTRFIAEFNPFKLPVFYVSLGFQLSIIYLLLVFLIVESTLIKSRGLDLPSKQIPRALFFPNYNLAWHHIIPPIWTYFVPPHSRKFFNQNQLSYVQGQYQKLYCLLMGLPIQNQDQVIQRQHQPDHDGRAEPNEIDMENILL